MPEQYQIQAQLLKRQNYAQVKQKTYNKFYGVLAPTMRCSNTVFEIFSYTWFRCYFVVF